MTDSPAPTQHRQGWLNRVLNNLLLSVFVFLSILVIANIPLKLEFLNPIQNAFETFDLTDLVFSHFKKETTADTNVVVVNIGTLHRGEVAEMLEILQAQSPAVIGIDAFFRQLHQDEERAAWDGALAMSLAQIEHLVMASELPESHFKQKAKRYDSLEASHPLFMGQATTGFVNLITTGDKGEFVTVRAFSPQEKVKTSKDTYRSELAFAVQVANHIAPEKVKRFLARNNDHEFVNFRGNQDKFYVLDISNVFDPEADLSFLKGKAILLGYMGPHLGEISYIDRLFTPLNMDYLGRGSPDMYGVVVHANIVSMILAEEYINEMPAWVNYLIAFGFCYFTVALLSVVYRKLDFWFDAVAVVLQLALSLLFLTVVVLMFDWYRLRIDIGITILSIFIAGFLIEIYFGIVDKVLERSGLKKKTEASPTAPGKSSAVSTTSNAPPTR
ncbi:CHASE2 domain-containing protein [Eisenibacter elegans]|uniref:CHASE2 domain-containing protein n=1 Tax=Eisenibacter elegans TaxID=997 RepID=UPI00040788A3|nr:CHASE2 domain-containing protein [Eisenibacter elegans]